MMRENIRLHLSAILVFLLCTVSMMSSRADESHMTEGINTIEKISMRARGVEIQLKSSRAFPVRAIAPVLHIGSVTFDRSFRPEDGDLSRLIFLLSPMDYSRLQDGEPMRVVYGRGLSPQEQWDFGVLVK